MADRYEAVAARKYTDRDGNEKTAFSNIGVAFKMRERDGFILRLHCLPAPVDGEYSILLFPPKPRDDQPRQNGSRQSYGEATGRGRTSYDEPDRNTRDLDDEIPF